MWLLKRTPVPGVPDAVRISAELLTAAPEAPAPLTDAELVKALRQRIAERDDTIRQLRAQISEAADPLPQHQTAAGTRAEARAEEAPAEANSQLIRAQAQEISDLRHALRDARGRLEDHETTARDRSCPSCAGLRRTIADLHADRRADRRRIAELELGGADGRGRTPTPAPAPADAEASG
jgi:DNA repair exonuclease SbcCD ATPase subunit